MELTTMYTDFPIVSDSLTAGLIIEDFYLHKTMMNDGIITYHSNERDHRILKKSMRQVERVTDIEFIRVDDSEYRDAEIVFKRHRNRFSFQQDAIIDMKINDRWIISVRKGKKYNGDLIHEFGHALGLEDSHDRSDGDAITGLANSIMSVTRNRRMKRFSNMDLMAISDIWNEY